MTMSFIASAKNDGGFVLEMPLHLRIIEGRFERVPCWTATVFVTLAGRAPQKRASSSVIPAVIDGDASVMVHAGPAGR
jgi:hypothetical protein